MKTSTTTLNPDSTHEIERSSAQMPPQFPSCPFCFSDDVLETLPAREMYGGTREVFQVAVCGGCGSTYITNFPENISKYYQGYYSFQDNGLTLETLWWKRTLVSIYSTLVVRGGLSFLFRSLFRCPSPRLMRVLSPNLQAFLVLGAGPKARILDVGSGVGLFVKMMNRFGYDHASGIDPFLEKSLESSNVKRSDIQSVTGTYDAILFNHSFEHLPEPEAALRKCAELLSPDGTVVIHIPNVHSPEFARFKQNWWGLCAPQHFSLPSRNGIELLTARCGFKVIDTVYTSRFDHYLYSEEYSRDLPDTDKNSVRRKLENGTFDQQRWLSLSKLAYCRNQAQAGDWVAYYLKRN